jgi:hypothetical protein
MIVGSRKFKLQFESKKFDGKRGAKLERKGYLDRVLQQEVVLWVPLRD